MNNYRKIPLISLLTATMVGCASVPSPSLQEKTRHQAQTAHATYDQMPSQAPNLVEVHEEAYVKRDIVPVQARLPDFFYEKYVFSNRKGLSFGSISSLVERNTGLRVTISPDAEEYLVEEDQAAGPAVPNPGTGVGEVAMTSIQREKLFQVSHNGTLKAFLDSVTARAGLFWRYVEDTNEVVVARSSTRTWIVNALPGSTDMAAYLTGQSESSGQATSVKAEMNLWVEVNDTIKSMLSEKGRMASASSIGSVTVTDTPVILAQINEYITKVNQGLGKQVMIKTEVWEVESSDNRELGLDWGLVYEKATGFGLNMSTNVLGGSGQAMISVLKPTARMEGSTALFKAIKEVGTIVNSTSASAVTLSGQAAPIQIVSDQAYLKRSSVSIGDGGISTAALEDGIVQSGYLATVLPRVLPDGKILLQFAADLSTLDDIFEVTSGDNKIQTPVKSRKTFMQRVALTPGNTLVVSGFQKYEAQDRKNKSFFGAGRNHVSNERQRTTVIVITPYLMDM